MAFVILPEGREGSGWANCLAQLRKLEKFFAGGKTGDGEEAGGPWRPNVCGSAGRAGS
jgi:hypothetical protein